MPRQTFMIAMLLLVLVGCGDAPIPGSGITVMKLEDVPPELVKAAQEKLPGVTFDTAWRKASGTYEIRGKQKNGKIREVDIEPNGTIVEVE